MKLTADVFALQQRAARLTEDVRQLERRFESAVDARFSATDDAARKVAIREAAVSSSKLADARQQLSDAKRAIAKAQGDEYER